jgi:PiT family inorganic phosphate transporter
MHTASISINLLICLIALALVFDFLNGFHDAANSIATVVSTGALKPHQAVAWAALFNLLAIAVFGFQVAETVGTGIVDPYAVDHQVIFAALLAAIAWNLLTWRMGTPSSSSHALIGGLIGATLAKAGLSALIGAGIVRTAAFIVLSPLFGFLLGIVLMLVTGWVLRGATVRGADRWMRRLQLVSSALYSLGHGGNDAQKTMGVIWLMLIAADVTGPDRLPVWVAITCYLTIALGTLFGGWRIVRTMGQRITRLRPAGGFCAETSSAVMLFITSSAGIPVSSTHTITSAIVGVGTATRISAVRWGVAGSLIWIWVLTLPATALMAAIGWAVSDWLFQAG